VAVKFEFLKQAGSGSMQYTWERTMYNCKYGVEYMEPSAFGSRESSVPENGFRHIWELEVECMWLSALGR
jgi:hypothetical protein